MVECLLRARLPATSGTEIWFHLYTKGLDSKRTFNDCGEQLDEAARLISEPGAGVNVYLRQERR